MTVIQGDLEDTVQEYEIEIDDPAILGYGIVPESSPFAMLMAPRAGEMTYLAEQISYPTDLTANGRTFAIYAQHNGQYYALSSQTASGMERTVAGVPIQIDAEA